MKNYCKTKESQYISSSRIVEAMHRFVMCSYYYFFVTFHSKSFPSGVRLHTIYYIFGSCGTLFFVRISISVLETDDGIRFLGALEKVLQHQRFFSLIFIDIQTEGLPAIIITDTSAQVKQVNEQCTALFEYTNSEIIGHDMSLILPYCKKVLSYG